MKLDKTDKLILEIIQEDGRITNAELAKRVGLSPAPTLERIKKLERAGIIMGYHAKLSPSRIGIGIQTFVEISLSKHDNDSIVSFVDAVQAYPEIIGCYHTTGRSDFLLRVSVKDMVAYEEFLLHKLTALPKLQHVETMIILSNYKEQNMFPIYIDDSNGK
ncbi:MAG: Lrp/AsnC family transcriptional regulator [FCB group bacterium]|nr:Lrp/AsnC family transcriptional regulator [FCB group bacterium]